MLFRRTCTFSIMRILWIILLVCVQHLAIAEGWQPTSGPKHPRKSSHIKDHETNNHKNNRPLFQGPSNIRAGATRLESSVTSRSGQFQAMIQEKVVSWIMAPVSTPESVTKEASSTVATKAPSIGMGFKVGLAYFCTELCCRVPVVLLPTIAAEQALVNGPDFSKALFVSSVASISFLGGGAGKLVNGLVCQQLGGKQSLSLYMMGMSLSALALSLTHSSQLIGLFLASIEFCMSMRWPASLIVLGNYYGNDNAKFAQAVTTLSLMSTTGTVLAKLLGASLLAKTGSWSLVAFGGAVAALIASILASVVVPNTEEETPNPPKQSEAGGSQHDVSSGSPMNAVLSVFSSYGQVVGRPLFWAIGFAHLTAFLAATSDRILGSFFVYASGLPASVCGGLTTCCTLGLVHGLARGRAFGELKDRSQKLSFLRQKYIVATLAALGLAFCGGPWMWQLVPSGSARAAIIACLAGLVTSSISFQFYHGSSFLLSKFGENKAIFLALLDGCGYFGSGLVSGQMGQIISKLDHGWSIAWALLAALYGLGGVTMVKTLASNLPKD